MKSSRAPDTSGRDFIGSYTQNVFRIILLASLVISFAVIITGAVGYISTENAVISKSKTQDMVFIIKSMADKIEGRIQRAMETSYLMARDPVNLEWLNGLERNDEFGEIALKRLNDIAVSYDYNSAFISSAKTLHYFFRENKPRAGIDENYTLSRENPADEWFFETIASRKPISLNVNFDRGMNDTFLFVNALMGGADNPAGIAGVGMGLKDITDEFRQFKAGSESSLWMVDGGGVIQLADTPGDRGRNFGEFLSPGAIEQLYEDMKTSGFNIKVSQYKDSRGRIMDYAYRRLQASDWILFYQIPRSENISIVNSIRVNTGATVVLVLLSFVAVFYAISRKIANPYRQVLLLNTELENKVTERTRELEEINTKVMDSIGYAKRMQEAILPSEEELKRVFRDHSVIWRPRDLVGGDFYWLKEIGDTVILAVGDCTGHGVPGALMTMTVNAILYHIVNNICSDDPEIILRELDGLLKQTMHKDVNSKAVDDGLDIAICCIKNKAEIVYAGAKIDLYRKGKQDLTIYQAYKKGVGYSGTGLDERLAAAAIPIEAGDAFILTTDGFLHQNGGDKDYPFGAKRFYDIIQNSGAGTMEAMKSEFEAALKDYMKQEHQRDDILLLAFIVR